MLCRPGRVSTCTKPESSSRYRIYLYLLVQNQNRLPSPRHVWLCMACFLINWLSDCVSLVCKAAWNCQVCTRSLLRWCWWIRKGSWSPWDKSTINILYSKDPDGTPRIACHPDVMLRQWRSQPHFDPICYVNHSTYSSTFRISRICFLYLHDFAFFLHFLKVVAFYTFSWRCVHRTPGFHRLITWNKVTK